MKSSSSSVTQPSRKADRKPLQSTAAAKRGVSADKTVGYVTIPLNIPMAAALESITDPLFPDPSDILPTLLAEALYAVDEVKKRDGGYTLPLRFEFVSGARRGLRREEDAEKLLSIAKRPRVQAPEGKGVRHG